MTFVAGQKLRASELNQGVPTIIRATADTSVVSSVTLVNATGLVAAVEADAHYWWRLLLHFDSGTTPDCKLAWTVPTGADGRWGVTGQSVAVTDYGDAATIFLDGANSIATLEGWLDTSSTAGNLQLRCAQNTSSGTALNIRAGSMLSIVRSI